MAVMARHVVFCKAMDELLNLLATGGTRMEEQGQPKFPNTNMLA